MNHADVHHAHSYMYLDSVVNRNTHAHYTIIHIRQDARIDTYFCVPILSLLPMHSTQIHWKYGKNILEIRTITNINVRNESEGNTTKQH